MSELLVVAGIGSTTAIYGFNRKIIHDKVNETLYKYKKIEFSLEVTKFFKFKDPYNFESVNQIIMESVEEYKVKKYEDCTYKIGDFLCYILPSYSFINSSDLSDLENREEIQTYPPMAEKEQMPSKVQSVTITITSKNKSDIDFNGINIIIDKIERRIHSKFHSIRHGSFIYFNFDNEKDLKTFQKYFYKKAEKQNKKFIESRVPGNRFKILYKPFLETLIATFL